MNTLICEVCGCEVKGENVQFGTMDKDVYHCTNRHCYHAALEYTQSSRLPTWVKMVEYQKAV